MKRAILLLMVILCSMQVFAAVNLSGCLNASTSSSAVIVFDAGVEITGLLSTIEFKDECNDVTVTYDETINLTFGDVLPGEVDIGKDYVFIDSSARPDLDVPAHLRFGNQRFLIEPDIYRDGVRCLEIDCANRTYIDRVYEVDVPGFSNYSLQGKKDFTLYSDDKPYVRNKVYQSLDLGDAYRADNFSCVVQIYGYNENGELVLVRSDPERKAFNYIVAQDKNQPESLGYFPVVGGIANVYFTDERIYGYFDYEYVLQCTSNATSLVYEEPLKTMYDRAGRQLEARAIWLSKGDNMFYFAWGAVLFIVALWVVVMVVRRR